VPAMGWLVVAGRAFSELFSCQYGKSDFYFIFKMLSNCVVMKA
jgi:hypothetical protein